MFFNYLKTTIRHISKSKMNFVFKLGGLTVAMSSLMIIVVYVVFQSSFDNYHKDAASIFRVNSVRDEDGKLTKYATVPPGIGPFLKAEFPEVKSFTRVGLGERLLVRHKEKLMRIDFVEADNSLFDVLTFKFLKGDKNGLNKPNAVILTTSIANQLFGTDDPIGKLITFPENNNKTLEVAGVIEDSPVNSHLQIHAIMSFNAFGSIAAMATNWQITWDGSVFLYVKLDPQAYPNAFAEKIHGAITRNMVKHADGSEKNFRLFLQPINKIYLAPGLMMEFIKKGDGFYIYVFSVLGFFLVSIATINYVNLAIADFHNRSKEIGIRKILGARKNQLAFQLAMESLSYCFVAFVVGLGVAFLIFPKVSSILDPRLHASMLFAPFTLTILASTILLMVLLSTVYSTAKLSINSPVRDLKREILFGKSFSMGKALLLAQFTISIICISITLVVSGQIDFIQTKDIGLDRENIVRLNMPEEYPSEKIDVLKNEIKSLASVENASYTHYLVTGVPYLKDWYKVEANGSMKQVQLNEIFVDHDFFRTMGIDIVAGRDFDIRNPSDFKTAFIINETAAREFGWSDPVGKPISYGYGETTGEKWEGTIIGVAEDFNTRSLHNIIEPLVIRLPYDSWPGSSLNIKIKASLPESLASIKSTYENIFPGYLFDYMLVEDIYDNQYQEETKALKALQFGTLIILLISAVGVFSLSLFLSMKRMKEFGIRKVLGATVRQIAMLHIGYFLRISIIAGLAGIPISYWLTEEWLSGFAYHVEPSIIVFLCVLFALMLLIVCSAAYSSVKASNMNPVDAIKVE
jgi:putative ABC transport system permease protein